MNKVIQGNVTSPQGFTASGATCGIKKSGKKDIALIYSEVPCVAAGVFTSNQVKASCVVINAERIGSGSGQAVIVNSGNANCMTGAQGHKDSLAMTQETAKALGISEESVYVASTGVIGKALPMEKILPAIADLAKNLGKEGGADAAKGILTTDTVAKEAAVECVIDGKKITIGAIAKGGGMIHPAMALPHATMLCFASTDADIAPDALRAALNRATQQTFNMITVDGDMSTNDMALVFANGLAKNATIENNSKEFEVFAVALEALFLELAKMMIRDAEGATKFVEITVQNAKSVEDARKAAKSVASSNLVKCAMFGSDPNWGRIAAAAGYSGAAVDPEKLCISMQGELIVKNGGPVEIDQKKLDDLFAQKDIVVTVDLGMGKESATAYTCDLSTEYVVFNSAYHT